jgi:hypothetical protein
VPLTVRQSEAWDNVVGLTQLLVEQIRAEDWDAASALEIERRKALELFFADPIPESEQAHVRESVERLLELDRHIIAKAQEQRDEVVAKLNELRTAMRAQAAYQGNR